MNMSAGDQAALKAAQDIIRKGQARGDDAAVAEGNRVQNNILADNGVMVGTGNKPDLTLGGTVSAPSSGGSYATAAENLSGSNEGSALASELKNLYSSNGLYAAALAAKQKANQANVDKAVSTLEGQKQSTTQSYAEMFQQLYQQKKNAQKNIGQKMAAHGVTGGASESTLLGLETDYSEALRQGHQGRADALGELDRAITAVRLDGDIANAQLAAASAKEQTAGYAGVLQTLMNRYDNQRATQIANQRTDAATKLSNARQLALAIAQSGNMPTDELLTDAGLSRADVESIVNSVASENAASQKPLLTAAQTLSALESGVVNDSTLAAYEYWYGQPWQQTSDVVVDPAKPPAVKRYNNEGLLPEQVSAMQEYYGLTPDGKWGPNSQSTTKMGAQAAWAAYQAANGIVDVEAPWDGKTGQMHVKAGTDNGVFGTHIKEAYEGVRDLLLEGKTRDEVVTWLEERYEAYPTRLTQAGIDYLMAEVQGYEKLMTGGK